MSETAITICLCIFALFLSCIVILAYPVLWLIGAVGISLSAIGLGHNLYIWFNE